MESFLLIALTGLVLGSLYFLLASGLALIFGLMKVLSFAHGAVLSLCAFSAWSLTQSIAPDGNWPGFILSVLLAVVVGAVASVLMEVLVLRRLFGRDLEQLLATVGIGIALVALMQATWGPDERPFPLPAWLTGVTNLGMVEIPNNRIVIIGAAVAVLMLILVLLKRSRHGLIIRAGVENREMVQSLGIPVTRSFTIVFGVAGTLAGLGGALAGMFYRAVDPSIGDGVLIFSFIVLIVGGVGSITGAAIAAALLGLVQAIGNFYIAPGIGDILIVAALAMTLLIRPAGIMGKKERLA